MPVRRPPVATFSAGPTTRARMAGPSSGTSIWRGLLAVSAARRRARVSSAPPDPVRWAGRRALMGTDSAMADMGWLLDGSKGCSRRLAERAGELQVDVIQVGGAGGDVQRPQVVGLDRGQRFGGGVAVERHG